MLKDIQFFSQGIPAGGKAVSLQHISFQVLIPGVVIALDGRTTTIRAPKLIPKILTGDPIIIKYMEDGHEYVLSGDVTEILDTSQFRMVLLHAESFRDNRSHVRHAVSLNAVIIGLSSLDYVCCTLKSISSGGVCINCKFSFEVDDQVIVNVIISVNDTINFIGKVIRKAEIADYFEYGLEIARIDEINKKKAEQFLGHLKDEEKLFLSSHIIN